MPLKRQVDQCHQLWEGVIFSMELAKQGWKWQELPQEQNPWDRGTIAEGMELSRLRWVVCLTGEARASRLDLRNISHTSYIFQ